MAKDVAEWIEYDKSNASKLVNSIDEEEKCTRTFITSEGNSSNAWFLTEDGVYEVLMQSKKPIAKQFKKKVKEILKTIRKTGGFVANEDTFINTYLPFADPQTKLLFRATLETVRKQNDQIEQMKPKVEYFDELVERNLLTNFRDTAKELHIKERDFIEWLLDKKYVYRDAKNKLKPFAKYVPNLFNLKEWQRNNKADTQTLITPKGRETFRLLLSKQIA